LLLAMGGVWWAACGIHKHSAEQATNTTRSKHAVFPVAFPTLIWDHCRIWHKQQPVGGCCPFLRVETATRAPTSTRAHGLQATYLRITCTHASASSPRLHCTRHVPKPNKHTDTDAQAKIKIIQVCTELGAGRQDRRVVHVGVLEWKASTLACRSPVGLCSIAHADD
jgi:hypothetical protein